LVEKQGIGARVEGSNALSISRILSLDTRDVALICICYIENATSAQIRYAVRRLRRKVPKAFIVTALVGTTDVVGRAEELVPAGKSESAHCTLTGTLKQIVEIAKTEQWAQGKAA
jgi:hypothetical protein